jgi:O-antigen/teichoic acid export membrane protein
MREIALSKIQVLQCIALVILVIFVVFSYKKTEPITWLFYLIAFINVGLWVWRLLEKRQKDD